MPERKKRLGRPSKLEDHHAFLVRMPSGLHRQLKLYAAANAVSLNDTVIALLQEAWALKPDRTAFAKLARNMPE